MANALLIREHLDHIEIGDLIKETTELRKDPECSNQEEVERDWNEFKKNVNLDEITVNGKTLNNILNFD